MKNIIAITGPTGVGKTKISVELAKRIDAEIINADSMQFYKELNIGTAKITNKEKSNIPHHLFDIKDIEEMYTIYDYQKDGRRIIDEILSRNKKVIIVGGSALYIRALLYDYKLKEGNSNELFTELSNNDILKEIKDYDSSLDIHINNRKRLVRTLNKIRNKEEFINDSKPLYEFSLIGLNTPRENLYSIINERVDIMLDKGLLEEVRAIYDRNIRSKSIMTGIGYKELYLYFDKLISFDESIELIKKNSRNYAKRQYTFLNNKFDIKWFEVNYTDLDDTINNIYQYISEEK